MTYPLRALGDKVVDADGKTICVATSTEFANQIAMALNALLTS